ncbi:MAG: sulfatase-like hydrolase/transferase, partial [Acidobacteria bacterium]|nr:sulfatase-like hydrolase/transferase [Acidobacteriota bacterium]
MNTTRREFLATGAMAAGAAVLGRAATRPPNIVLVLLDDLGYGDFGCYGQELIRTPNIDRVAAEGTRFTDCYAGGVVCAPSRSVLMSGLDGGHAAVRANAGTIPIAADDITVAQVLKQAGYATGGFGKWGLGDAGSAGAPTRHGFDQFFGYLHQVHAHSYYTDFLWDNEKKFPLPGNANGGREQYSADVIAERSFQFIADN